MSLHEWVEYVRDYQTYAIGADDPTKKRIVRELSELVPSIPEPYLASGELQAALAAAYAELRDFELAVHHYEKATGSSDAPLRAAEQLGNCEGRLAEKLKSKDPVRAASLFEISYERLKGLVAIGESSERLSLVGATLRRWAGAFPERRQELYIEALSCYSKAAALDPPDLYYPLSNKISIELTLGEVPSVEDIDRIEASASRQTDVWARGASADAAVLRFVGLGIGNATDVAQIVKRIWRAGAGTTERQRSSLIDMLEKLASDALATEAKYRASELVRLLQSN